MHIDKINQRIKEVNQLVLDLSSKYNWFDFQFSLIQEGIVRLEGCFDLTALYKTYDKIEIEFFNAIFIKTILYEWQLQKDKSFIELDRHNDILKELNISDDKYYAFKINTDSGEPILIIAEDLKCAVITKDNL